MRNYRYPAVIFTDPETGHAVIAIYDLSLFAEGDTVEEAHAEMEKLLASHMSYAIKNELLFNDPTPFAQMVLEYPNEKCILVEAKLDNKNNPIL